ncbi:hypothetical protein [Hyphococcus sp.]|uniref:hypothetical protein n=1 Tax=Hyphococcus sp. TaxID=2038636 RepID=UPI003CCC1592
MGKTRLRLACGGFFAFAVAACAPDDIGAAKYSLDMCRRVALEDSHGEIVRGAEDLALDQENNRLFVAAYDRRAVEKAARSNKQTPPDGGVYAINLATLFDPHTQKISVVSLASPGDFTGGLRPHGLHYDAENHELIFVNRTYARQGRKWRMTPRLQRVGANGEVFIGEASSAPCAANDVATSGARIYTTFDHASCGFGASIENVFRLKRSGVMESGQPVFAAAAFANGIARFDNGRLAIAATREKALIVVDEKNYSVQKRIALPGGPDNLTKTNSGEIIAALHPSMVKLALNRKLGVGHAPSRIVKVDMEKQAIKVLFDDARGELFSAATVAVETNRGLVAGSVTDEGLLVCQAPV